MNEGGMHRLAHGVVASEGERYVGETSASAATRAAFFDFLDGIDEVHSIVIMFLHTSGDCEDIKVEDDILRIHADLFGQNLKGALGDADFFVFRRSLSFLVKGHDDNGGSVAHNFFGLSLELVFAPFETD